jgi:formylglycine-generating enzyme
MTLMFHFLSLFTDALETARGRVMGVDEHLKVQELAELLAQEPDAEKWSELVVPLFAKNEQEQKQYTELCTESLRKAYLLSVAPQQAATVEVSPTGKQVIAEEKKWRFRTIWLAFLIVPLLLAPLWLWWKAQQWPEKVEVSQVVTQHSTTEICPEGSILSLIDSGAVGTFCQTTDTVLVTSLATYTLAKKAGCLIVQAKDTTGLDSICLTVNGHAILFSTRIEAEVIDTVNVKPLVAPAEALFLPKDLPYPRDLASLEVQPRSPWEVWISKYHGLLKALTLLLLGFLMWAWVTWREKKRRTLIAEVDRSSKAPYIWNIKINDLLEPEAGDDFQLALNKMRRRSQDEMVQLDMAATIKATVQRGGMPEIKYKQLTKPTEYLLLIDRQYTGNHRAQLFDSLYAAFKRADVLVDRYFFDGDMRLCYKEHSSDGVSLQVLQKLHGQSRLIVLSNGYQLLSSMTGQLAPWTTFLQHWRERSILTPTPTDEWGRREEQLDTQFTVMPSSLQGLNYLIECLDSGEESDIHAWKQQVADAPREQIYEEDGGLISTLKKHYEPAMVHWIAACAVYPTMHYDLTLYLGQEIMGGAVTTGQIAELTRLPWFIIGEMPKDARIELLSYLEQQEPALLERLRWALHKLLTDNHPPKNSVAYDNYRMSAAMNEWLITPDKKRKKALEQEIAAMLDKGIDADVTVVKYLDRERNALDFVVPDAWKKQLYPAGSKALGIKSLFKDLLYYALPVWLMALGACLFWNPTNETCAGQLETYKDKTYCLQTIEQQSWLTELKVADTIKTGALDMVDTLARPVAGVLTAEQVTTFNANIAIGLYNQGTTYLDDADPKPVVCPWMTKAATFDTTDFDLRRALAWCAGEKAPELRIPDLLQGRVIDATTKQPIAGVQVVGSGKTVKSRGDGHFILDLKKVGYKQATLSLQLDKKGYLTERKTWMIDGLMELGDVALRGVNAPPPPVETPVIPPIDNGTPITPDPVVVKPTRINITGTIVDEIKNVALADVEVKSVYGDATTDQSGKFVISFDVPDKYSGSFEVDLVKTGYKEVKQVIKAEQSGDVALKMTSDKPAPPVGTDIKAIIADIEANMVLIKKGSFKMGSDSKEKDREDYETQHQVTLSRDYYLSATEVTFEQYDAFCDATKRDKPDHNDWERGKRPVINVSWDDAVAFCAWVSTQTGKTYRLPTEAEWEYACRAGTTTVFNTGNNLTTSKANYNGDYPYNGNAKGKYLEKTVEVGSYKANAWGLYDMHGNVYEWCSDWFGDYPSGAVTDPKGDSKGSNRVLRGGSWYSDAQYCRSADRNNDAPSSRGNDVGFRLVSQ